MTEIKNQTRDDARARVVRGKIASLTNNPSWTYLEALRQDLYAWIEEIDTKMAEHMSKCTAYDPIDENEYDPSWELP